ncbi:MAG: methyltransferase domain-containing protein [Candidatus Woesearchaeota archaeon]
MSLGKIQEVDKDATIIQDEKSFLRLDLACGNNKKPGFIGMDISTDTQADIICDLSRFPWKLYSNKWSAPEGILDEIDNGILIFKDSSVGEFFCSHYIEHTKDIKSFMEEVYRILIPKGKVTFIAPYYSSIRAFQDYTHVRPISESTFLYFNQRWLEANSLQHYNVNCNFEVVYMKFQYYPEWKTRSEAAKEWARVHMINVVMDIETMLVAIK